MPERWSVTVRVVLVAVLATLVVFAATAGFGLFDQRVDVLLIGDSIMSQSGPYLGEQLPGTTRVGSPKVRLEATPGTGLLTPALMDWQARAEELVERYEPRVVVVLFVGNYTDDPDQQWIDPSGRRIDQAYGPAFFEAWHDQARTLTSTLGRYGATVDWVLPPPMLSEEFQRRAEGLRDVYRDLAREIPTVELIDARPALGGADGEFVWQRPGLDGELTQVRTADSLHLTPAGGRLLARQMAETVGPQLDEVRARERRP